MPARLLARRAVATLLRLARTGLADAALVAQVGSVGNAAGLAATARGHLVAALCVSEAGWPLPDSAELDGVPAGNPVKPALLAVRLPAPPAVAPDGRPSSAPPPAALEDALSALSAVLATLAERFGVALDGADPADRAGPLRPEPAPAPPPATPPPAPAPPPARPVPPASSAAFWALMDRWGVADLPALHLVGRPGGLTKAGTRPRFKLQGPQAELLRQLQELDAALDALGEPARDWLRRPLADTGEPALDVLLRDGVAPLARAALRQGLRSSMAP